MKHHTLLLLTLLLFACVPANVPITVYETALNAYYEALAEPNPVTQRSGLERADQLASAALSNNASDVQMRLLRANIRYARFDGLAKPNETTSVLGLKNIALGGVFDLNTILVAQPRSNQPLRATVQLLYGKWMLRALIAARDIDQIKYNGARKLNHAYTRLAYAELMAARAQMAHRLANESITVIKAKQKTEQTILENADATSEQRTTASNNIDLLEAQHDRWQHVQTEALDLLESALVAQANALSAPHEATVLGRNSRCVLQELNALRREPAAVPMPKPADSGGDASNQPSAAEDVWDSARHNGPGEGALEASNIQSLLNQAAIARALFSTANLNVKFESSPVPTDETPEQKSERETKDQTARQAWVEQWTTQLTLARRGVWFSVLAALQIDPSNPDPDASTVPDLSATTTALIDYGKVLDDQAKPTCATLKP
jgi:hypothetical protein